MIDKITLQPQKITDNIQPKNMSPAEVTDQFGKFLNDSMADLNAQQITVDKLNNGFVKGEISDVHQLMIASQKASLGLELTVQVRNKVIEAYQEIMRMQV
ncbi:MULTISPECIES: flagellar hook-basal body complex protein FliE [unclassified Paenibacillus]|uniref:flagellar hook-basal body complex protein FliE n=1 Tax=unclassified Paenibacillus TaxID=185978 RepID=UPI001AE8AA2B|nr:MULTISPECIES: flagellar hook-basal body complex protein FliE [unclassified Paenibacillus]MBP1156012.1 flagellar hook-basal body complex protein FliE [Paenibacillus sp. PvP091]MBP1168602.1 flagellar hook-basal body complex protein FliE [Paenibacillus sp. PvR098]MBP2439630.1 flagellar hook-basal body complex protein FliE [Paenibacillus sp. PvP052]